MLVKAQTVRVEIPHEPGEWMELRRLAWVDVQRAYDAPDKIEAMADFASKSVAAWSYDEPPTLETIRRLDPRTGGWLLVEVNRINAFDQSEAARLDGISPSTAA